MTIAAVLVALSLFIQPAYANPGDIVTVAGGGVGDGLPATAANLNEPSGVAVDSSGNLFIADSYNNRIRKVDTSGVISTVAGNGTAGFSGDRGRATAASLNYPHAVAVDSAGNLFIADSDNNRIRRVDTSGVISTVAGNGKAGWSGDFSSDGGPAEAATLSYPEGVAVDSAGNLFIADTYNHRIRKVDTSGVISTVAGNGGYGFSGDGGPATAASLYFPYGVTVDSSGNLFIADNGNNRIRKVDTSGVISTVAGNGTEGFSGDGGGPATSASVRPGGVAVDSSGNLFIADTYNKRIRKVNSSGVISTVAGNGGYGFSGDGGPATAASLDFPYGVAVDSSGNLFIADYSSRRIRKVDTSGMISTVAGNGTDRFSGDGGLATAASLGYAQGVAVDSSGNLFIADYGNHRIRKVDTSGGISTVAGNGTEGFSGDGGQATAASLAYPTGVAVDSFGNLFLADTGNHRIRKVDTSGGISTIAGNGTRGFLDNVPLPDNIPRPLVPTFCIGSLTCVSPVTLTSGSFAGDGGQATSASLNFPTGVAVDSSGNLFIADYGNHRIRKVNTSGVISTVAGNAGGGFSGDGLPATSASLANPAGVAVDSSGNLFIADTYNGRIRKVNTSGVISTVAGNGGYGFSGDGGQATAASLNYPEGVAVDSSGNLFIADTGNNRIRKVNSS